MNCSTIKVVFRGIVALHRSNGKTDWARPGDVIELPLDVARPLIRTREVGLVDQATPATRTYWDDPS